MRTHHAAAAVIVFALVALAAGHPAARIASPAAGEDFPFRNPDLPDETRMFAD